MKREVICTKQGINGKGYVWKLVGNGFWHCEDGPANVHEDGTKQWYVDGKHHREDGPATEYPDGRKEWYLNGERLRPDKAIYGPGLKERYPQLVEQMKEYIAYTVHES
jgi:hypothetical protein